MADRQPGRGSYAGARRVPDDASAGGRRAPTFGLLELATGGELSDRDLYRPAVQALSEMALMVASLDNDLHSLHNPAATRTRTSTPY
jgi:hypothetical protein